MIYIKKEMKKMRTTGIVVAFILIVFFLINGCVQETEEKYTGPVEKINRVKYSNK